MARALGGLNKDGTQWRESLSGVAITLRQKPIIPAESVEPIEFASDESAEGDGLGDFVALPGVAQPALEAQPGGLGGPACPQDGLQAGMVPRERVSEPRTSAPEPPGQQSPSNHQFRGLVAVPARKRLKKAADLSLTEHGHKDAAPLAQGVLGAGVEQLGGGGVAGGPPGGVRPRAEEAQPNGAHSREGSESENEEGDSDGEGEEEEEEQEPLADFEKANDTQCVRPDGTARGQPALLAPRQKDGVGMCPRAVRITRGACQPCPEAQKHTSTPD
jgi:hypothetical protein